VSGPERAAGDAPARREALPVAILMERRMVERGRWRFPHWEVLGVVAGEGVSGRRVERTQVHGEAGAERHCWTGLELELYRDGAESYWYNLTSERPSLFVVCRSEEDGDMRPFAVTADHDEACAFTEVDESVYAVPMPPEVHQQVERFVVTHYVPKPRRKRRRSNWSEESGERRESRAEQARSAARGTRRH